MPLSPANTRTFHRTLYGTQLQTVTLLKRNDDQQEGTVRAITLYECWKSSIHKTGEPINADMMAEHRTIWHFPSMELDRVGVNYINPIDRIVDSKGRYWQAESTTPIDIKMFENFVNVACVRVDPPKS